MEKGHTQIHKEAALLIESTHSCHIRMYFYASGSQRSNGPCTWSDSCKGPYYQKVHLMGMLLHKELWHEWKEMEFHYRLIWILHYCQLKGTTFICIFKSSKRLVVYLASRMRNSIGHLKSVPLALFGNFLVLLITQNKGF